MCEYLSFVIAGNGDIHVGNGWSHSGVAKAAKLAPGTYREAEWTEAGLEVRLQAEDDRVAWYERVERRWQSREALEAYLRGRGVGHSCPNETGEVVEWDISDLPRVALVTKSVGGDLPLSRCSGLTALPEGLSVGGHLYLAGCSDTVIAQARSRFGSRVYA